MSYENNDLQLPEYNAFNQAIQILNLSGSGLHGLMCGFLCAGANNQGETYLQTLAPNPRDEESRGALLAIFSVYSISQQLIASFNFEFNLLLPDDTAPLMDRARSFSEWCEGFIEGMNLAEVDSRQLNDEEAHEAFQHIGEFALLDSELLDVNEEDERALMEVTEYTRMAVLRLHADLMSDGNEGYFENTH